MAYTKTTWLDRIVQFANRYTKSNETTNSVDLSASPGTVTQAGTPLSAFNLNKIEQGIADAHDMLTAAGTLPFVLKRGLNIASTTGPSPGNVTVYGRTLVNLLGKVGAFDGGDGTVASGWSKGAFGQYVAANGTQTITALAGDTSTERVVARSNAFTLYAGKYYIFLVDVTVTGTGRGFAQVYSPTPLLSVQDSTTTNRTIALKIQPAADQVVSIYLKNTENTGGTGSAVFDNARFIEVSTADFTKANVDVDWTGDKLAEKLPYIESVKHLQGAAVRKVGKNLVPPFTDPAWTLHSLAAVDSPYSLTLNATSTGYKVSTIMIPSVAGQTYTFKMGGNGWRYVDAYASDQTTNLGSRVAYAQATASPVTFTTPANTAYLKIGLDNGNLINTFTFTDLQLELGSVVVAFQPYNADYFNVPTILASNLDGSIRDSVYVRDGQLVKLKRWITGVLLDGSQTWSNSGLSSTGFKEVRMAALTNAIGGALSYAQAYLTRPDGQPMKYGTSTAEINSFYIATSDKVPYFRISNSDTGFADAYTPSVAEWKAFFYGYKMNNGTFGTPYDGTGTKTWTLWNATSNTGAVTTVPSTLAAGFTPYTLDYVLATSVEEVISGDVGSIALAPGGNQLELLEGVIVREKVTPKLSVGANPNLYHINNADTNYGDLSTGKLKNRSAKIIAIYKDRNIDPSWTIKTGGTSYGLDRAECTQANFDPNADYFVTYILLEKYLYTANATDAKVEYQTTLGGTVAQNTQDIADIKTRDGIQDFGLDYIEAKADNLRIDYDGHAAKTTSVHGSTAVPAANKIAMYDANGLLVTGTPTASGHATNKNYVDTLDSFVTPSDNILLSLPVERGGGTSQWKVINLKYGGKYRIKMEVRSTVAGNTGRVNGRFGWSVLSTSQNELAFDSSSTTYSQVVIETPFLPPNMILQLYINSTPYPYFRNVQVCGDLVPSNPNTLSGVDV
ncbi:hypothetical protein [Paenibacillus sp. JDR-2]|uniref:hypothetical protein n=1 Tax=Paenibacillus sp. (strain JDR-2) TaxID=324057 RepID=UPI000166A382|nr:hypothetical protein [Paenibacillus sp. JDR-2]ACT00231.1 hypothetical protein Pjdr2_1559 [Paenibacillus sp. JDR-2]